MSVLNNPATEERTKFAAAAGRAVSKGLRILEPKAKYQRRFETLKELRRPMEEKWRQVRDLLDPGATKYLNSDSDDIWDNVIDDSQIFDTTPRKMAQTAADGLHGGLSSPAVQWFSFFVGQYKEFNAQASHNARRWLETAEECVRDVLAASNFYPALYPLYKEMLEFGISMMMIYSDPESIARFYPYTVGSFWCAQNNRREIDSVYMRYVATARDLVVTYGMSAMPQCVKNALERDGDADRRFCVIQAVQPWGFFGDQQPHDEFKYEDVHFIEEAADDEAIIYRSGFRSKPFVIARWAEPWDYVYPRTCPGIDALPDIRQLYTATKVANKATDWLADPAWFVDAALATDVRSIKPGQIIEVSGSSAKNPIQAAIPPQFNLMENIRLRQSLIERISGMFYNREIMMVSSRAAQNHVMTATEVDQLRQEKNAVMGPITVRSSADIHIPTLDRVFEIITREWMILDEPPEELIGQQLKPYFTSDLAITQRQAWISRANDMLAWMQAVMPVYPQIRHTFDFDRWAREFEQTDTVPAFVFKSPEAVDQAVQAEAQAAAAQQQMQMINQMAETGQKLGKTPTTGDNLAAEMGNQMAVGNMMQGAQANAS